MKSHTHYLELRTQKRRELVRITDEVRAFLRASKLSEGLLLVSAMHITAAVFINDDEPGLHADLEVWLQRLAPGPSADDASPGPDYLHNASGEDNGDAHLKNLVLGHQVTIPITAGELDLGPWQQIFYYEFDGRRTKRVVLKAIGE